jgi:hypothetical protein
MNSITESELNYIVLLILAGGFGSMVINSLFKVDNIWIGIAGLVVLAYLFKLR